MHPCGTSRNLLHAVKILRHGTSGFTSHLKDGVLWIFIALKNPLPWSGLNLQPFGPVASTLTTTPPRQLMANHTMALHIPKDITRMQRVKFGEVMYMLSMKVTVGNS
jgi:hypothetical protein